MNKSVVVLGGGGHAKVVVSSLIACGIAVEAIVDNDEKKWGRSIFGAVIVGLNDIPDLEKKSVVVAIGDNRTRRRLAENTACAGWERVVHPHAYVHPDVSIGEGTVVFAGAVIQPGTVIGSHCIINTNAAIDHDCVIGDHVHIGPGACLAGEVSVNEGVFIGAGGVIIMGKNVGKWSVVGAGGVVTKDIPDHVTAVGVPARVIKETV